MTHLRQVGNDPTAAQPPSTSLNKVSQHVVHLLVRRCVCLLLRGETGVASWYDPVQGQGVHGEEGVGA